MPRKISGRSGSTSSKSTRNSNKRSAAAARGSSPPRRATLKELDAAARAGDPVARKKWAELEAVLAKSLRIRRSLPERHGFNADLQKVADPALPARVRRAAAMRQARVYLANRADAVVYERFLAEAILRAGLEVAAPSQKLGGASPIDASDIDKVRRLIDDAIARHKAALATAGRSLPPKIRKGPTPATSQEIEADLRKAIREIRARTGKRPTQRDVARQMDIEVRTLQIRITGTDKTWDALLRTDG